VVITHSYWTHQTAIFVQYVTKCFIRNIRNDRAVRASEIVND
jgi:hypothetical protein